MVLNVPLVHGTEMYTLYNEKPDDLDRGVTLIFDYFLPHYRYEGKEEIRNVGGLTVTRVPW